jgi:hypothetical protein
MCCKDLQLQRTRNAALQQIFKSFIINTLSATQLRCSALQALRFGKQI